MLANDLMMEDVYGSKTPHIDLSGPQEGQDIFLSHKCYSWVDFWTLRFDNEVELINSHLGLPEGVDIPLVNTKGLDQIIEGSGKKHRGYMVAWEERYSENFSIWGDFYVVLIKTGIVPYDEEM